MLESIEKLREWAQKYGPMGSHDPLMFADEIEREIAANYCELPKDADGVPIRYGDKLSSDEMPGRAFTCFTCLGFNVTQLNGVPWWTVEWRYDGESGTSEYVSAKSCRHVKPRTLTDVLADLFDRKMTVTDAEHEIGELLGGDA